MEIEGFCRGCLIKYNEPMELLQYTEKNRRLFVYSTGLQVKRNDTFTFQLCKDCFLNMKQACKFKKLCRTSDRRFKSYIALKDVGDPVDFCTFLKNSDDTLTFRLPMTSGNSTPANQKCRDDDNESTCTSIRNFMTDILQGEEMPDTEARIIREVIEEEADVLDDSLDSHWLQEDMSIDTDFRLDLSFSPFSTPRTVNNDRCFTPKKSTDQKEDQVNYYTLNTEKQTNILNDFTNAFKNDQNIKEFVNFGVGDEKSERNNFKEICEFTLDKIDGNENSDNNPHKNKQHIKELCDFSLDDIDGIEKSDKNDHSLKELCDLSLDCMDKSESSSFVNGQALKELCDTNNDVDKSPINAFGKTQSIKDMCDFDVDNVGDIEKSGNNLSLPSLDDVDKDKINVQNFYIPRDDSVPIQSNNNIGNGKNLDDILKDKPCTIDINLDKALKNVDHKEFSLDDLLVSPPVLHGTSAASTPTITNILFGEKLELTDNNINPKIGQCIDPFDNVQGDIEIFEELFQNDTREFDVEDIKRDYVAKDIVGIKTEDTKESIGLNSEDKEDKMNIPIIKNNEVNKEIGITDKKTTIITATSSQDDGFDLENSYCKLCSKKFKSGRALSIHFAKSHNVRIIKPKQKPPHKMKLCNTCGKQFRVPNNFKRHVDKCSKPETIFKCELCPVECKTQATLARHMAHHTMTYKKKDTGKEYLCTICGLTINKIGNYRIHIKRHKKIYDRKCETCGKGFYGKWDLDVHMRSHTGETPFACKLCPRAFARRDVLSKHVRIHTGEKLFQCDYCGWKCYRKYDMKCHIMKRICIKKHEKLGDKQRKNIKKNSPSPIKEIVTVFYATGDDNSIRKQLPFLETDMSN